MDISIKFPWVKRISRNAWFVLLGLLLCAAAGTVYFSNLTFYSCFVDDEFQSAYAAYDLMNTGYTEYTRAYPATWLLAKWIAVFGFSESSCRSLSALYGVVAVASVVFITRKMTNSLGYTAIVSTMFIAEPILTYYFRFTRLYSLAVLLALWLYYCIYQWLIEKWWYFIPVIPLLLLAYFVNVNSLILMGGVVTFVVIKAFTTRRRLYIVLVAIVAVLVVFSIVNLLAYHRTGTIPIDFLNFYGNLIGNASTDLSFTPDYIRYLLGLTYSKRLSIMFLGTIVVKSIVDKKMEEPLLFTGLIFAFTAVFMTFFANRYFTEQYIITAVPFVLMTYGYAYIKINIISSKLSYIVLSVLLIIYGFLIGKSLATFHSGVNPRNMDYQTAYEKIGEYYDLENETVPIIQSMMRVYGDEIVPHKELAGFDRENDMSIWMDFGHTYLNGIVTVEWLKTPLLTPEAQTIIYNWTNRISGEGVDDTGVNVGYYVFLEPEVLPDGTFDKMDGYYETDKKNDIIAMVASDNKTIALSFDYNAFKESLPDDAKEIEMLFLKLDIESDDGDFVECVGLYIPSKCDLKSDEKGNDILYTLNSWNIRGKDVHRVQNVAIEPNAAVYGEFGVLEVPLE